MKCRDLQYSGANDAELAGIERKMDINTATLEEASLFNSEKGIAHSIAYNAVKRCMDILLAVVSGLFFLIPLLCVCVAIVIKDFGNPFYRQRRVGKDGKSFSLVKLRSMRKNADNLLDLLDEEQLQEYYNEFKLDDDPRLLGWAKEGDGRRCFGAWIRRLSIDEIPQIYWNILIKGNMSFIGPRPIIRDELEKHYTPAAQKILLSIKPGLTGYWQAYARNNATYETGERQRMELYYVQHYNLWLDIKILFATVGAVLSKTGAK